MSNTSENLGLEHVQQLLDAEEFRRAREWAQAALERLPATADARQLGALHLAWVQAGLGLGEHTDAVAARCRETLGLVRGDAELETGVRLAMLRVGIELPEYVADAEDALVWLGERRHSLAPAQLERLIVTEALTARLRGEDSGEVLRRGIAELRGTTHERVLRLEYARAMLEADVVVEDLDALVLAVIDAEASRRERLLVECIVWDHHPRLRDATVVRALVWARERAPHLCGFLLARRGQEHEAIEILRDGAERSSNPVRAGCMHALLELLPVELMDERLRYAEELEAVLDEDEHPPTRHDVALAMSMVASARNDAELMERALANADQAARGFADAHQNPAAELVVGLVLEVVKLRAQRPTAELASLARRLVWPMPGVAQQTLADARASSAAFMSTLGPICDPRVLATAETLAELASVDMSEHPGLALVVDRCRWLRRLQRGLRAGRGEWPRFPLDDAPAWLIELVLGATVDVSLAQARDFVARIPLVVHARPDRADHVLAALVPTWAMARGSDAEALERAIGEGLEATACTGPEVWAELRKAVLDALTRTRTPWLLGMAASIARARGEAADSGTEHDEVQGSAEERASLLIRRARHMSESIWDQHGVDVEATSAEARRLWREVLVAAREIGDPHLEFSAHVGLGNALRKGQPADLDGSLECYMAAVDLHCTDEQALAQLCKVTADALFERGTPEDLRRATNLIERSISRRTGRLRAESLLSAARIAERHPDHDEHGRSRRAVAHLMSAVRADKELGAEIVPDLCRRIVELRRLGSPMDTASLLDQLEQRYPEKKVEIRQARHGVGRLPERAVIDFLPHVMVDADAQLVVGLKVRLTSPDEQLANMLPKMPRRPSKRDLQRIRQELAKKCLLGDSKRLVKELERLRTDPLRNASIGGLVGQVLVLRELVSSGERPEAEVRAATEAARQSIARSPKRPEVRAYLLLMLGTLWQSLDGRGTESMCDFDLSAALAREGIEMLGGEDRAPSDFLGLLARSYRYTQTGDRNTNLRVASDLYSRLHTWSLEDGNGDMAAHALNNQVDAEMEMAVGDRCERLRGGIARLRHALELAGTPQRRAEILASIAFYMQALTPHVDTSEQIDLLEGALKIYDSIDSKVVPSASNLAENRFRCVAVLVGIRQGPEAEVAIWEQRLADRTLGRYSRAIAQHNLAIRLRRVPEVNAGHLQRAMSLFEQAYLVREPESGRHGWETAFEAGLLIAEALHSNSNLSPALLPWSVREAIDQGNIWLGRAITAAEQLGRGQELADAALVLAWLACAAPSCERTVAIAERAWVSLRRATPYLVLNAAERGREATMAMQIAVRIATLGLEDGVIGVGNSGVQALTPKASELVSRWLLRAQASAKRPLSARLERPQTASASWWSSWQDALDQRVAGQLGKLLEQLHDEEPDYLCADLSLDETWRWLERQPGSVALALVLAEPMSICVQLGVDADGERRTRVLCIPVRLPPGAETAIAEQLGDMIDGQPQALLLHDRLVEWSQAAVVAPLLEFLRTPPKAVLWCPGPLLRLITPSLLWHGVPVACTHSLALPIPRVGHSERPRSSLVVAPFRAEDPIATYLPELVTELVEHAERLGPVRTVVSAGDRYGKRIRPDARDSPASAAHILAEAPQHDLLVVLAHGSAGSEIQAVLECVDADGSLDELTGRELARHPGAIAGATVLLLACSSGRIGGALHAPDGVAGALLSAGARAVIAPLWSVSVDVALRVARDVFRGIERERSLWEIIAELPATILVSGPDLGEVADEMAREGARMQRLGFVVWLG